MARNALSHAPKNSPRLLGAGRPVSGSTGPHCMNSGTFSIMIRSTRSDVHQVTTCHGSMRCWSLVGFPPRARL